MKSGEEVEFRKRGEDARGIRRMFGGWVGSPLSRCAHESNAFIMESIIAHCVNFVVISRVYIFGASGSFDVVIHQRVPRPHCRP